jgi:DNA primase
MNILDALNARGIDYRDHSSKEDEIWINCPFCEEEGTTPDTRFRLGLNVETGKMHCFNCNKSSDNAEYTFAELNRVLETGQMELAQKTRKRKKHVTKVVLPGDFTRIIPTGREHWNRIAYEYLRRRGVAGWQIREKNIGFSLIEDMSYRIVIPVYYRGKLQGLVGRAFVSGLEPKYKNSLGDKVLYNVPDEPRKAVVLSEGAFDALAIERYTVSNYVDGWMADSLGVLGHDLTNRQLEILDQYKFFVLWPDPDRAGLQGFFRIARQLIDMKKKVKMVLPSEVTGEGSDPSDLDLSEIAKQFRKLTPYSPEVENRTRVELAFQE